jgi:hypothetical protein
MGLTREDRSEPTRHAALPLRMRLGLWGEPKRVPTITTAVDGSWTLPSRTNWRADSSASVLAIRPRPLERGWRVLFGRAAASPLTSCASDCPQYKSPRPKDQQHSGQAAHPVAER